LEGADVYSLIVWHRFTVPKNVVKRALELVMMWC